MPDFFTSWLQFLSVIPVEIVRWILVAAATVLSAAFLGSNLKTQITVAQDKWVAVVAGAVSLQVLLGIVLKLYFFTYFSSVHPKSTSLES